MIQPGQIYRSIAPILDEPDNYRRIKVVGEPNTVPGGWNFGKVDVVTLTEDGREIRRRRGETTPPRHGHHPRRETPPHRIRPGGDMSDTAAQLHTEALTENEERDWYRTGRIPCSDCGTMVRTETLATLPEHRCTQRQQARRQREAGGS